MKVPIYSIRTFTGLYVDLLNPDISTINIEDIAHALSNMCRFGGHTPKHYSVAQHCVYVAQLLAPNFRLQGLLHDAAEAYLVDIPSPLKRIIKGYDELEENIMKTIALKFGSTYPLHPSIKGADMHMLKVEWENLMANHTYEIPCWSAEKAKAQFLKEFNKLTS